MWGGGEKIYPTCSTDIIYYCDSSIIYYCEVCKVWWTLLVLQTNSTAHTKHNVWGGGEKIYPTCSTDIIYYCDSSNKNKKRWTEVLLLLVLRDIFVAKISTTLSLF